MRYFQRRVESSGPYVLKISEYSNYSEGTEVRSLENTVAGRHATLRKNVGWGNCGVYCAFKHKLS
jgi:hypothetical protein